MLTARQAVVIGMNDLAAGVRNRREGAGRPAIR